MQVKTILSMSIEEQILEELRQLNQNFRDVFSGNQTAKVPEAARILKVGAAKLRTWCKDGLVPCSPLSDTAKHPQYLVDISGARKVIAQGGYIRRRIQRESEKMPKRKTRINLSIPKE